MKRKHMVTRFRLPYTAKQVYAMLYEACRVEVAHRHREFNATEQYKKHLWDISNWITSEASTFGLFLCGDAGNGKTTILRALQNLINYLRSDEGYNSNADAYPIRGYMMVSAKELVLLAKAYNNPTRDNTSDVARYKRLRQIEILAIDELGSEPKESIHYGDYVTAAMDMLSFRYEEQLTATPNKKVTVRTSWDGKLYAVTADAQGTWKLAVSTPEAGGPYTVTFDDGTPKVLSNILIGELWLCSGQSNMEMPMKGFKNQPVENANMDILRSRNPEIRLFTVKRTSTLTPQNDVTGSWKEASPAAVRDFSATAYYFGRLVNEILDVPVGLIVAAWGGSACEAWMTADWLKAFPDAKIPRSEADIKSKNRTPTVLYNGMLHPLIGLTMKGVIWYQGEDNWNRAHTYADMFTTLINGWRAEWKQGDFPFYYCQIAPYDYGIITERGKEVINTAYLREAQAQVEHRVPNTGMAVLLDAGMEKGIHPARKQVAGERLALLALDRKSTRLNSSHIPLSRMPSSA